MATNLPFILRCFHPVLPASQLRSAPVSVQVDGMPVVIFRDSYGQPVAARDHCGACGGRLSAAHVPVDGALVCPASAADAAPPPLDLLQAVERWSALWVAWPDAPLTALPDLDWSDEGYRFCGHRTQVLPAPLPAVLDAFSDEHLAPLTHAHRGWMGRRPPEARFETRNWPDRTQVTYAAPQREHWLAPVLMIQPHDWVHNQFETRFDPVRTRYDVCWTAQDTQGRCRPIQVRTVLFYVPLDANNTAVHLFAHVRLARRGLRYMLPVLRRVLMLSAAAELEDGHRYLALAKGTAQAFAGGRLARSDAPLLHNRRLLQLLYYGRTPSSAALAAVHPEGAPR